MWKWIKLKTFSYWRIYIDDPTDMEPHHIIHSNLTREWERSSRSHSIISEDERGNDKVNPLQLWSISNFSKNYNIEIFI